MTYYIARSLRGNFDTVVEKVTEALKQEGFGVLTQINVADTLKQKIDVDMPAYRILGACNPKFAHQALSAENKIGVMLPCNVIIRAAEGGVVEVAAIDPRAAMKTIGNPQLTQIAEAVAQGLTRAVDSLS